MQLSDHAPLGYIPMPSLRINSASVAATLVDLIFLAIAWEYQGCEVENRPVLAILKQVAEIKRELTLAQQEIERRKRTQREREKLIGDLQEALSEVKTLRGFLPICAHCKKIRDDEGYWQQIELYIQQRSEAQFSHGICPECARSLYPELEPGESN